MSLNLPNLSPRVRQLMGDEIAADVANGTIYISDRLSPLGKTEYIKLLVEAAAVGTDISLEHELRQPGRLNQQEQRRKPNGGYTMAAVPVSAPETLAEGEFNRFYARALCRFAIEEGISKLTVYRAKPVSNPRATSEMKLGQQVDPKTLLLDLRTHKGVEPALGIPPGPNSGLSVKLPD